MKPISMAGIAFAAGLAGGWFTAVDSEAPAAAADTPPPSPRVAARQHRQKEKAGVPADVAARLAPIYAATNPSDRLKATILLAQSLPVSELARWYENEWFQFRDGADLNVFYEITRSRWLREDPESLMDIALLKNWSTLGRVAGQWARLDPDGAIAYLEVQRDPRDIRQLQGALMKDLADTRPEWVLEKIAGNSSPTESHRWRAALAALADKHPGQLLAVSADWPAKLREGADQALTTDRLTKDFPSELDRLLDRPKGDSILSKALNENHQLSKQLSDGVFRHANRLPPEWFDTLSKNAWALTRNDPERWLRVDFDAMGVTPESADQLRNSALSRLASTDPLKALAFLSTRGGADEGSKESLQTALRKLELSDPGSSAGWLDRLAGSPGKIEFRESVEAALETALSPKAKTADSLMDTLESASGMPNERWRFQSELIDSPPEIQQEFTRMVVQMAPSERLEIGRSLLSQGSGQLPFALRATLVEAVVSHPEPAGETSHSPERNDALREASNLGVAWVLEDPAAATRWVAQLPAGEARRWTLRNMAANWMSHDDAGTRAWIGSLPAAERADVQEFLEKR